MCMYTTLRTRILNETVRLKYPIIFLTCDQTAQRNGRLCASLEHLEHRTSYSRPSSNWKASLAVIRVQVSAINHDCREHSLRFTPKEIRE